MTGLKISSEELIKKCDAKMLKKRSKIEVLPGAMECVRHLKACKIPQAIVTMSNSRAVAVKYIL